MRYYAIPFMRERLLMLKGHFRFADWEPELAPAAPTRLIRPKHFSSFRWKSSKRASWLGSAIFHPSGCKASAKRKTFTRTGTEITA